jgi:hypothetical protein
MKALRIGRLGILTLAVCAGTAWARYLSPEPLLQNPNVVSGRAQQGRSMPTYAYASNNPIGNIDPDGRLDIPIPNGPTIRWPDQLLPLLPVAAVVFLPPLYCHYNPTFAGCSLVNPSDPPAEWPERCEMTKKAKNKGPCFATGGMNQGLCTYVCADGSPFYAPCGGNPIWPN